MQQHRTLQRDEIIGRRVLAIASVAWSECDLDYDHTYLSLDNGIVFCPPHADCLPLLTEIDSRAESVPDEFVRQISSCTVRAMYLIQDEEGAIDPLSLLIELFDGRVLTHSTVEPHGTGLAGLRLYPKGHFDLAAYSDYWSLVGSQVASQSQPTMTGPCFDHCRKESGMR